MQFDTRLTGDAASLAREHRDLLGRLPATLHAFILVELQRWPMLFAPEQRYQRTLLAHLARMPAHELKLALAGIARVESEAGAGRMDGRDPGRFQNEAQALLRKRRLLSAWRSEVDGFFQTVSPSVDAALFPPDAPRRLVVQIYGGGIAIQPGRMWGRFKDLGVRVPLSVERTQNSASFLRGLLGGDERSAGPMFSPRGAESTPPLDTWLVESHEALHDLLDRASARSTPDRAVTGLSYERLRAYRDELTRALYDKIRTGVESPQAFAAYARSLKIAPQAGSLLQPDDVVQAFVRDVFLTGNGTLFVNNTFVEWASVQALRRAQPRVLVARYGVRDKLKPFSSLLLFSQPRPSDQIPLIEDPVGSFVDVEQLSYYVWLNAEKSAAYRNRTLYLFLAEGADEMLALRSDRPAAAPRPTAAATLADVRATMAEWLGVSRSTGEGRAIDGVIG